MGTKVEPHPDQVAREQIPKRRDLPTKYRPFGDMLMIIPIIITERGAIIIPGSAHMQLNEGHIVEKGPMTTDKLGVGAVVCWNDNMEVRMACDDGKSKFVLLPESAVVMFIPAPGEPDLFSKDNPEAVAAEAAG